MAILAQFRIGFINQFQAWLTNKYIKNRNENQKHLKWYNNIHTITQIWLAIVVQYYYIIGLEMDLNSCYGHTGISLIAILSWSPVGFLY